MVVEQPAAWRNYLAQACVRARVGSPLEVRGTLTRLAGLVLETSGLRIPVGSQCLVSMPEQQPVLAALALALALLVPLLLLLKKARHDQ